MSVSTEYIENLVASGVVNTTSTLNATSTSSGSVVVAGGGGVALDWYVGGTLHAADIVGPGSIPAGLTANALPKADGAGSITNSSISDSGTLVTIAEPVGLTATGQSTSSSTGALVVAGGLGLAKDLFVGGAVDILSTLQATSSSTGSLVLAGGVGLAKDLFVGGAVGVLGTAQSTSTSTGALVLAGGVGIAKNAYIGGLARILDTASATSTTSGSLVLSGGLGIAENCFSAAAAVAVTGAHSITFPIAGATTNDTPLVVNIPAAFSPLLRIGAVRGTIFCATEIVAYSSVGSGTFAAIHRFAWSGAALSLSARQWGSKSRDPGLDSDADAAPIVVGSAPFLGIQFSGVAATNIKWAAKVSLTFVSS